MFVTLLSFLGFLPTKCTSLTNEACMDRSTFIALNAVEVNYHPFMISLDKCNGRCNAVDDLITKVYVSSEIKDVNVKIFNTITRIYAAKALIKYISCDCKRKFSSTTCNSNQIWNNNKCQCEFKKYCTCKKDYSWNPSTCICENSRYLKSIADDSVAVCEKVINAMDSASTNVTNTTNVKNTVPINCEDKKVRLKLDYYILRTFLLAAMLLFPIAIICYRYIKHRSKEKKILKH